MTQEEINKIETLIGWVKAAGEGKCPFPNQLTIALAEEAQCWIDEVKMQNKRN